MNDVREAIERVGVLFDPPGGGFDDLSRRRTRARVRRRLTTGALALTVAAGGSLLAVLAFPASTPRAPSKVKVLATWAASAATPSGAASSGTTCPTPSGDGDIGRRVAGHELLASIDDRLLHGGIEVLSQVNCARRQLVRYRHISVSG